MHLLFEFHVFYIETFHTILHNGIIVHSLKKYILGLLPLKTSQC